MAKTEGLACVESPEEETTAPPPTNQLVGRQILIDGLLVARSAEFLQGAGMGKLGIFSNDGKPESPSTSEQGKIGKN